MRAALILLLLLATAPSRGDETAVLPGGNAPKRNPAAKLVAFEKLLSQNQEARDQGRLSSERYQLFVAKFRTDLDAVIPSLPPTPANKGLHAQILSRLGEQERGQALNSLTQALDGNPTNPDLLRARGQILYEQGDFPGAAESARQAWEASGRTDKSAEGLLKMSEGRVAPISIAGSQTKSIGASGSGPNGSQIPENRVTSSQAMTFMQKSVAARQHGDLEATWANAQAAMNADPTSPGVQKFYETVKADVRKRHSVVPDGISTSPTEDPKPTSPLLPLLLVAGMGLTAAGGYKIVQSRGTQSSDDGLNPSPEVTPEQSRRNYLNSAVMIGTPLVIGALVYGGPIAWRALAPVVSEAFRGGQQSFQRVATSQAGAILPEEQAASQRISAMQKLPWNSWAQYPKEMVNGREYAKIGERLYTQHAVDHMMPRALNVGASVEGRGMSPTFVEDVILRGAQSLEIRGGVQRTIHTLGTAQIITEGNGKIVVTVNPFGRGP